MAEVSQCSWNSNWGVITSISSTPIPLYLEATGGWSWNDSSGIWTCIEEPSPIISIYQESETECDPVPEINTNPTNGETYNPPGRPNAGASSGIPSRGTVPSTSPAPSVSNVLPPAGIGQKFFNVCFNDYNLNLKGWTRPRWEGCKLSSLHYNVYSQELDEGKEIGPLADPNLSTDIDELQFLITGSFRATGSYSKTIGNIFEQDQDSGYVRTLKQVSAFSCRWQHEFRTDIAHRETYPPKTAQSGQSRGIDQLYQSSSKVSPSSGSNFSPFGPKLYDIPLVPTTYYKTNPYTQEQEKIERKEGEFDLISKPIILNPIGGPNYLHSSTLAPSQILGNTDDQDENGISTGVQGNKRLSSEYQYNRTERTWVWSGWWEHDEWDENANGGLGAWVTVSGFADPTLEATWGYNEAHISRSAIIPRTELEGDITYGTEPVISTYSNAIFVGTTIYGFEENDVFPGPGPDFSYIKLDKAIVFNSDDDSFFIQELKKEGEDETFSRLLKQSFPWGSKFKTKLLDYDQSNNLKTEHGVHWNRGYFSLIASYSTASAHHSRSGHYPGTGDKFVPTAAAGGTDVVEDVITLNGNIIEGAENRHEGEGGYYYLASDNGGGDAALLHGSFKPAGMGMGNAELDFERYPKVVDVGDMNSGPGYSNYYGRDPFNGGMRFYNFKFEPVSHPRAYMNKDSTYTPYDKDTQGRMLSGTFKVNTKNPSAAWWIEYGGKSDILWVSESQAGDVTQSLKIFMDKCYKRDDLHIITFNEAKNVDKEFNQGFYRYNHSYRTSPGPDAMPGYPGDINYINPEFWADPPTNSILNNTVWNPNIFTMVPQDPLNPGSWTQPFGDANEGNTTTYAYYKTYNRPINTFGSLLFSDAKHVKMKGAHGHMGSDEFNENMKHPNLKMYEYDYSSQYLDDGTLSIKSGSGPVGGVWGGGINAPRFLNGKPFVTYGDVGGEGIHVDDGRGTHTAGGKTNYTHMFSTVGVWTAYWYGNNTTIFDTGNRYDESTGLVTSTPGKQINPQNIKGWPSIDKWTIEKLEERPNFILTDLNKKEELPNDLGSRGFIIIPDNLNPRIKANLDYYIAKAGLTKKETAPKHKDKSIKKGVLMTIKRIRPRPKKKKRLGWFWKFRRRKKWF